MYLGAFHVIGILSGLAASLLQQHYNCRPHTDDVLTHGAGAGEGDFLRGRLTLRGRGGAGAGAGDLGRGAGAGICRGGDRDGLDLDILKVMTDQLI